MGRECLTEGEKRGWWVGVRGGGGRKWVRVRRRGGRKGVRRGGGRKWVRVRRGGGG